MKEFTSWLKRLSLSQQLFMLIFSFIGFFCFFFFIYISSSVEAYTYDQMSNILENHQDTLTFLYDKGGEVEDLLMEQDTEFLTFVYVTDGTEVIEKKGSALKKLEAGLIRQIENEVKLFSKLSISLGGKHLRSTGTYTGSGEYSYYSLKRLDDHYILVNLMNNSFPVQFKDNLMSRVIDITILVVSIFFMILMMWVTHLIRPLNHIRTYIEKIKLGKDAKLNIDREDEIGELAHALVNMREELKRQEKTKEEMIHNISHDLKTPIATIKSYAESIKDGIYPYDTLEKSVDVIIHNSERLEKKVYSLLFLNRLEYLTGKDNEDVMCDMKSVVEMVVLNTKVIRSDIEMETNLTSSFFRGSEEAWRVTVENILENALRYAQTMIVITLDEKQLCIYNDGPQIREDKLQSMFKPYEKGQGGQFGLGLSIVHKVVTANKYRVVAENVETGGVIFKIMK